MSKTRYWHSNRQPNQQNHQINHYPFKPLEPQFLKTFSTRFNRTQRKQIFAQSLQDIPQISMDKSGQTSFSFFTKNKMPQIHEKNTQFSCEHRKMRAQWRKKAKLEDSSSKQKQTSELAFLLNDLKKKRFDIKRLSQVIDTDQQIFSHPKKPMEKHKKKMYEIFYKKKLSEKKHQEQYPQLRKNHYVSNYIYMKNTLQNNKKKKHP